MTAELMPPMDIYSLSVLTEICLAAISIPWSIFMFFPANGKTGRPVKGCVCLPVVKPEY
jgi:hypothetical protein